MRLRFVPVLLTHSARKQAFTFTLSVKYMNNIGNSFVVAPSGYTAGCCPQQAPVVPPSPRAQTCHVLMFYFSHSFVPCVTDRQLSSAIASCGL